MLQVGTTRNFWLLKNGPVGCFETSVMNCHYTLRYIPDELGSHLLRGGSQKSSISS